SHASRPASTQATPTRRLWPTSTPRSTEPTQTPTRKTRPRQPRNTPAQQSARSPSRRAGTSCCLRSGQGVDHVNDVLHPVLLRIRRDEQFGPGLAIERDRHKHTMLVRHHHPHTLIPACDLDELLTV